MFNKIILSISLLFTLNLNADESFLNSIKHKTSHMLESAKESVDNIDTNKIESTVKNSYTETSNFISSKINENNTTKKLKETTISSYNKLRIFTKQSIEYSKQKLECLSK